MRNIAFFGKFNSGKSTLVNSFLGRKVVPEKVTPTHLPTVKIDYGEIFRIELIKDSYSKEFNSIDWKEIEERISKDRYSLIKIFLPHPYLKYGCTIWDTPGLDDIHPEYTNRAEEFLSLYAPQIDVAFYLISETTLLKTDQEFIKKLNSKVKETIILHSKADRATPEDSKRIIQEFENVLRKNIGISPKVIPVSNKVLWEYSIYRFFHDSLLLDIEHMQTDRIIDEVSKLNNNNETLQKSLTKNKDAIDSGTNEINSQINQLNRTIEQKVVTDVLRSIESNNRTVRDGFEKTDNFIRDVRFDSKSVQRENKQLFEQLNEKQIKYKDEITEMISNNLKTLKIVDLRTDEKLKQMLKYFGDEIFFIKVLLSSVSIMLLLLIIWEVFKAWN
jgi:small GTP-binding protein